MTMEARRVAASAESRPCSGSHAPVERDDEKIDVTRRGVPVDRLVPEPQKPVADAADWLGGLAWPMGGASFSRDEIYDCEGLS